MFVVPKDASAELPVILRDDDNYATAKTGIAFGAVTLKFRKWNAVAWTTDTVDSGNWTEVGNGHYTWEATSTDLNTAGLFFYIVQAADCVQYEGAVFISSNDFDDLATDIVALNDPTAAAIADAIWDEVASGHTAAGTFGKYLDQQISVTESNIRGADDDDLKDISDEIAALSIPTAAAITDAVWDEVAAGHTMVGTFGAYINALNANIDQSLSATEDNIRGADNDDLRDISDEIAALSIPTAVAIADAVWDEAAADHTAGGSFGEAIDTLITNVDVVLSTRSSHLAADVDTTLTASHGAGSWTGSSAADVADAVWDEATAGHVAGGSFGEAIATLITNIDQSLSATEDNIRGADSDDLKTISDQIDGFSIPTAAAIADQVWDEAAVGHVAGGSFGGAIATLITNVDVVLSTRSSHSAADVDTQLSGVHGAGSWEGGGAAPTVSEIADAVWDEAAADHVAAGSFGEAIDTLTTNIDVVLSTRSSHTAAGVDAVLTAAHGAGSWEGGGAAPTVAEIADAVLEELIADHSSVSGSLADVIDDIQSYHQSPRGHVEFE